MKNIKVPALSAFDFSKVFDDEIVDNAIFVVDNLIKNGRYRANKPTFQTFDDLFQFNQFSIFKETFKESCHQLVDKNFKFKLNAFCYYDFLDNWILKNRDEQWHNHKESSLVGVMYLKFEDPIINPYSGTEFKNPDIGWTVPTKYTWHIFTGNLYHRPGIITTKDSRYVLTATCLFYE